MTNITFSNYVDNRIAQGYHPINVTDNVYRQLVELKQLTNNQLSFSRIIEILLDGYEKELRQGVE